MNKIPISLNIDDFCPIVHVYYEHSDIKITKDGRELLPEVPLSFMEKFCALVEKYGVKGKLSVVPLPGCKNPYGEERVKPWMNLFHEKLEGKFSFCPEMITHHLTYDIDKGVYLDIDEETWSNMQNEKSLANYIQYALTLLKERGVKCTGVTSPWHFGSKVKDAYENAILEAFIKVYGKGDYWYFLETEPSGKPRTVIEKDGSRLFAISATIRDYLWQTIDNPKTDIKEVADFYITEDGKNGAVLDTINLGGHPVMLTHWQSLFSNGSETGLEILEEVLIRIKNNLSDKVEFMSYDEKL